MLSGEAAVLPVVQFEIHVLGPNDPMYIHVHVQIFLLSIIITLNRYGIQHLNKTPTHMYILQVHMQVRQVSAINITCYTYLNVMCNYLHAD